MWYEYVVGGNRWESSWFCTVGGGGEAEALGASGQTPL